MTIAMLNWPKLCLRLDRMNRPDRGSHFSTSPLERGNGGWGAGKSAKKSICESPLTFQAFPDRMEVHGVSP